MASLGLGWVGEPALAHMLDPILEAIVPPDLAYVSAHGIAFIIAFSLITVMHIVFGELAPKTIALQRSESTSLWVAAPLEVFLKIFRPIIYAMNGLGRLVVNAIGLQDTSGHALIHSEADLRMLVTASAQGGYLEETEQEIIDRAFVFHDDTAIDVMLPRTEIIGLPLDADATHVQRVLQEHRLERYPVWEGDSDHISGVLHARDALATLAAGGRIDLPHLIRPVLQVPTSLPLDRLIEAMREARTHIAVAVDEFGGTAGVIELERVIERLVGPLPDEFTRTPIGIDSEKHQPGMVAQLDGLMLVQDVNETFGLTLDETSAHTIGGLVFHEIGHTPHLGDSVEVDGARLIVTELDGLRISGVRLERIGPIPREDDPVSAEDRH
jgi:CBS domain containing-hemolysin-like protein